MSSASDFVIERQTMKELEAQLREYYGLNKKDLPNLRLADGSDAEPCVLIWLLTAHEKLQTTVGKWDNKERIGVVAAYLDPGLCKDAVQLISMLDSESFQSAVSKLADCFLGPVRSKKMYLAYPVCRYARETLMERLTESAHLWRSKTSGVDAPPLAVFRKAIIYSNTRAAMVFTEYYRELCTYVELRGLDEDTVRDEIVCDTGFDEAGCKSYDLGNQVVTARIQSDLSILIELANGKTAKSLPKRGSSPEKYVAAADDLIYQKREIKYIAKRRTELLFADFLSGRSRNQEGWCRAYLSNPVLHEIASRVVWMQGEQSFLPLNTGIVDCQMLPYPITDEPIRVAHPMEMAPEVLEAWKHLFAAKKIMQPFMQLWEPLRKAEEIRPDRYENCHFPEYELKEFLDQSGFINKLVLPGCTAKTERNGMTCTWQIQQFSYLSFNRTVNHTISVLDSMAVKLRIGQDDIGVMEHITGFTLAQITEFIAAAQVANATNVLAALLEYKNTRFADFDPMDEFTLEW